MPAFIQNMPIWQKCLLPIAALALAAIGITLYMSGRMGMIDDAYSALIDHEAKAAIAASRMNARARTIWALAYETIAETDVPKMQQLLHQMSDQKEGYEKLATDLRNALPNNTEVQATLQTMLNDMSSAYQAAQRAGALSLKNTTEANAEAMQILHREFDPALAKLDLISENQRKQLIAQLDKSSDDLTDTTNNTRRSSTAGAAFAVILCTLLGVWMALRSLVGPLNTLNSTMGQLARRDWGQNIAGKERRDEIGAMARTVETFKQNGIMAERLAHEAEAEQAKRAERSDRLEKLVRDFEAKAGNLVSLVSSAATEMEATAQSLSSNATQSTGQASLVAEAAQRASSGVQTAAAAAEELAASIGEISRQVAQSAELTQQAVSEAQRTDTIVKALSEGATKIGQVVDLITNIAGQTNLLALNATIEAARAGDAGKGFAVVASEVKSLAHQTATATQDISTQISQLQEATSQAVQAINAITGKIADISSIATTIASAVEEQGAATSEIARNVQQTAANTQDVTSNIVGVSEAAQHTGAAASQVFSAAGELSQKAENLTAEVRSFVSNVRAA